MFRIILALSILLTGFTLCFAQGDDTTQTQINLKAGMEFSVKLETPIDVTKTKVGSDLSFKLLADLKGEGGTIPKGSVVSGRVVEIQKVSAKKNHSVVGIIIDFCKFGEEFVMLNGIITSVEGMPENVKYENSDKNLSITTLSLEGKNIMIESGKSFNIKLTKNAKSGE